MKVTCRGARPKTESDLRALPLIWTSNFTPVSLNFFIYKMGLKRVSASLESFKNHLKNLAQGLEHSKCSINSNDGHVVIVPRDVVEFL